MNNPLFVEVKESISKWINGNDDKLKNDNISVEILIDEKDCLRVELNFGEVLAEIFVEEPDFAPYRYVNFQAVGIVNDVPELLHFWYDEDGMSIREIIENLDKAINFVLEYRQV